MRKTPLNSIHRHLGARMVNYAGWELPLRYRSEIGEHLAVRRDAGMFDVSHMTRIDVGGPGAVAFLRHLLANDVARLKPGQALYSCLLNEAGGIIDDLVVGCLEDDLFRLVSNAATRARVIDWLRHHAGGFGVGIRVRDELAMIAVQGPKARGRTEPLLPGDLGRRAAVLPTFGLAREQDWLVSRTGYTGEDGYEIMLPSDRAEELWHNLRQAGVRPCGLAARDSLRLEAGLNLYGRDMDETVSPLECGLARTVALDPPQRRFIGREALERLRAGGVERRRVGLVLLTPGILRHGQRVRLSRGEGCVTSGGFSPLLKRSIALARVPVGSDAECEVEIRKDWRRARIVEPPFVRRGRILINMEQRDE